jgi:CheY-like chemotaxis protein
VDVLIAEDDPQMRSTLRILLERQGYTCAEVGTGSEAVDLARRHPPRCVFLDLGIPVLDGFGVARALRADPRTSRIHLHCLTGRTDPATRLEADRAGFETFLTKPVDAAQLIAVVRAGLEVRPPRALAGLTKAQAEEVLDRLEARGCRDRAVAWEEGKGFTVCYAPPAA